MVRVAGVAEDITERRQLEAQLGQAQKMEAVGQLAGGVAHDFNNFLTVIASCTYLLLDSLPRTRRPVNWSTRSCTLVERSGTLTRQLLSFSRQQVLAPKIVNLNTVIRDTESMLRRAIGEDVELEAVLAESLGTCPGRSRAAGAGALEPRRQRPRRDAPRWHADHRDDQRHGRRRRRGDPSRRPVRVVCAADGDRLRNAA